jgi:hypothetical protein
MAENGPGPNVLIEMAKLTLGGKSGCSMIRFLSLSVFLSMTIKTRHIQ